MTNRVNCWKPLRAMTTTAYAGNGDRESVKSVMDWAISSQASQRWVEGSTTNAHGLEISDKIWDIYGGDYEATRVRDDQNLFDLQERLTSRFFSKKKGSMQNLFEGIPGSVEKGQPRKAEEAKRDRVQKGWRPNSSLYQIVCRKKPRKGEKSYSGLGKKEFSGHQRKATFAVSSRYQISKQYKGCKLSSSQAIETEYAFVGYTINIEAFLRSCTEINSGNRRNASCGSYYTPEKQDCFRSHGSIEFARHPSVRKLQEEQQFGRRYSLDLARKTKKYGINNRAITNRQKIWDISKVPLPFTDAVGSETSKNPYKEWTTDALAAPNLTNAVIDGSDASGNNTVLGSRVGNHHQISTKVVRTSFRADDSDVIGRTKELSYQMMRRQQELRRDVEAIVLTNQASFADTGSAAGKAGGLPTWLTTNFSAGATGAVGGFQSSGVTALRTYGTARALTETLVRDAVQSVYTQGGDPSIMMSVPGVIRKFSEYLFTSSARVATLMSDQGKDASAATALGSVNVFVTDFGTLKLVPNRLQTPYTGTAGSTTGVYASTGPSADVFIIDPSYLAMTYMKGYRTEELAKTGLAENRQMSVDWSLICNTEKSHAIIGDITIASAVTA